MIISKINLKNKKYIISKYFFKNIMTTTKQYLDKSYTKTNFTYYINGFEEFHLTNCSLQHHTYLSFALLPDKSAKMQQRAQL